MISLFKKFKVQDTFQLIYLVFVRTVHFYFSDPHKLGIRCHVNGKVMQDSNTENLVFKTEALVSYISR